MWVKKGLCNRSLFCDSEDMKKYMFLLFAAAALVMAVAVFIWASQDKGVSHPSTVAEAKQDKPENACVSENKSLAIEPKDREDIEMAAAMQLIDVPAGTQTEVSVATYDAEKGTATGSELYPGSYGTYNFTAKKKAAAEGGITWEITTFDACKN
jgi:hypothetical protein